MQKQIAENIYTKVRDTIIKKITEKSGFVHFPLLISYMLASKYIKKIGKRRKTTKESCIHHLAVSTKVSLQVSVYHHVSRECKSQQEYPKLANHPTLNIHTNFNSFSNIHIQT